MSPVCRMADNGRLTVDQKVKVVLFYAETKSVVATQRRFHAHFGTGWAPCRQTIYRLSLGTVFQPMRINSVPGVKWFCNNKNMLCVQSMVWHFVRHPVWNIYVDFVSHPWYTKVQLATFITLSQVWQALSVQIFMLVVSFLVFWLNIKKNIIHRLWTFFVTLM